MIGSLAGLLAAISYDVFRLPFVFSHAWGLNGIVPQMPLFKVFPRFGAMILNQPLEQAAYPLSAHVVGWIYHFSNGVTFGVMYVALIGQPTRRTWWWGVFVATGIEMALAALAVRQVLRDQRDGVVRGGDAGRAPDLRGGGWAGARGGWPARMPVPRWIRFCPNPPDSSFSPRQHLLESVKGQKGAGSWFVSLFS
jgi:hypothetical protein